MSGILLVQSAATIYAGTSALPAIQTGAVTGAQCTASIATATPTTFAWTLAVPPGSGATLSSASTSSVTFTPDVAGDYNLRCIGDATTYLLALAIVKVAATAFTGPLSPAYLAPASVATPSFGVALFCDSTNSGALSFKDTSGAVKTVSHS